MKTCHRVILLFALVVAPLASASDDDQADQEEYCEDSDMCDGPEGEMICKGPKAGIWCPKLCKEGCGAPAGTTRKRRIKDLQEYKNNLIKAAQELQTSCRDDDTMCCDADEWCPVHPDGPGRNMCKHDPEYCCRSCMNAYGQKNEWKRNQLLSLLARILEK